MISIDIPCLLLKTLWFFGSRSKAHHITQNALVAPGTAAWPTRVPAHGTIACGTSMPNASVYSVGWDLLKCGAPKDYVHWFISPIKYRYIYHKPQVYYKL